ncbi:MAG: type II toxin-antitoxin system RelE/ParE family toxin [Acidobacteriota bacterium]
MKMEDSDHLYTFYEAPVFTARLARFADDDALPILYAIQADLLADPLRWPIVKGTGGARKGRIADPASDQGKSGSYRYLYLYLEHRGQIFLLFLFAKSAQSDLSAEQKKAIARQVEAIKKLLPKEQE